jgi:hypothetical protein
MTELININNKNENKNNLKIIDKVYNKIGDLYF